MTNTQKSEQPFDQSPPVSTFMGTHTPGPWTVQKPWNCCAVDGGGGTVADQIDWLPDAILIAAAPDLKESNYALAMLGLQSERYQRDPDFRDAVDAALAANAKAEGR